jgi:two-component system response regulator AtoC
MGSDIDLDRNRFTGTVPVIDKGGPRSPHLLVVEASSSRTFPLPARGELLIGRGPEAELPLTELAASRRHATISVDGSEVQITDLGSLNGTAVNGERLNGQRLLLGGDTVTIGQAALVLYLPPAMEGRREPADVRAVRQRLHDEVVRARVFERPVSVVLLLLGEEIDRDQAAGCLEGLLRPVDVAGWSSAGELVVVLPEIGESRAAALTRRLLEKLAPMEQAARAGFAVYPASACDPDALLAAARAAARGASAGSVADPDGGARIQVGDRTVIVADPAMTGLMELIRRLAPTDLPVLVEGETGVGKENAAYALHQWSPRNGGPFVAVNCATFSENLVESELFGNEKGAFSGAVVARAGLLESAAGGTIFFDEIGELPRALQPKLLRVLESKRALRVGGTRERELDVRVVAATNRNLAEEVQAGRFREDLLFRLNAATIVLPPLRDRPREIAVLARTFLTDACKRLRQEPKTFSGASLHALTSYPWPGNVRELRNVADYLAATTVGAVIDLEHLRTRIAAGAPVRGAPPMAAARIQPPAAASVAPAPEAAGQGESDGVASLPPIADEVRELERRRMLQALELTRWAQARAAELIGMPLRTFQQKAKAYGLRRGE